MHRSIELNQSAVFATARYDAALFQRAYGKHRSFVHASRHLADGIRACRAKRLISTRAHRAI